MLLNAPLRSTLRGSNVKQWALSFSPKTVAMMRYLRTSSTKIKSDTPSMSLEKQKTGDAGYLLYVKCHIGGTLSIDEIKSDSYATQDEGR